MRRARAAVLSAVALLASGATALSAQPHVARADTTTLTLVPEPRLVAKLAVPIHPTAAPSPDGRLYAVLQTRPDPILWIVPGDGGAPFAFRKMWAAYKPRWSPSGGRIGFIAAVGPPRIWTVEVDPASGRPIDPPRLLIRTAANAFAFSPNGERIALVPSRSTAAGASEIRIVHWESRKARTLLREDGVIYRVDWAPDGATLYYGLAPSAPSADSAHRVRRVRVAGGAPQTVRRTGEFLGLSPDGDYLLYRPAAALEGENVVEIARVDGGTIARVVLEPGTQTVGWAAAAGALLQVRPAGNGYEIRQLWLCPVCGRAIW
jgi:hypothetical protein